jgi:hypothetical protein
MRTYNYMVMLNNEVIAIYPRKAQADKHAAEIGGKVCKFRHGGF